MAEKNTKKKQPQNTGAGSRGAAARSNAGISEKEAAKAEQQLAREQRQELKQELTDNFAQRQRLPRNRQRIITFSVLGVIALLAILFTIFVLLPTPDNGPHGGVAVGTQAPAFSLPVQGGTGKGTINLGSLKGHPVVLNFWSVTCPPCNAEMPYLRGLYAHYGANGAFTLLGIDQGDPGADIQQFGQRFQINYPLLFDAGSSVNVKYGVTTLPQTYFIDSAGVVRYVIPQQLTPQTMQQGLQAIGVNIS
jgi:cytochrome c biogenesis protein CcmG/thiol:disulfide interchange protein DsbE